MTIAVPYANHSIETKHTDDANLMNNVYVNMAAKLAVP